MSLEKVKKGLCPLGHGKLDQASRCIKCSANWVVRKPEDGTYQCSGYGSSEGQISVYSRDGNFLMNYSIKE